MGEFADKLAAKPLSYQRAYLGSLLPNYVKSGNLKKYYQKLTDFNFMMAKIQHPELGVQALIDDFNLIDDSEALSYSEYNPEKVKTLTLIQRVLWMSADILERDPTKLVQQLLERLMYFENPDIQAMLEVAKQWKAAHCLRSLTPCFTPLLRTLKPCSNSVNAVAITADGKQAISGLWDKTIQVWNLTTGREEFTLKGHSYSVNAVAVTANDKRGISGLSNCTLKVWDFTTQKEEFILKGHSNSVTAFAVTADGKLAISGLYNNIIKVWDLINGDELCTLKGHSNSVNTVAVTADGKRAISGSSDCTLKVWDLITGKEEFTLEGHNDSVTAVAITADGKLAISGSYNNIIKVWNLINGDELCTLKGHWDSVNTVAVTADGKRAISGSQDRTIKVWDLSSGKFLASFTAESSIACCAVAPDGVTIVAGDASGRVYFLRLEGMEALT
jgi:WD40 repeat protein